MIIGKDSMVLYSEAPTSCLLRLVEPLRYCLN